MMERAAEFRVGIAEVRDRGGRRWRLPVAMREEMSSWALDLREAGYPLSAIAGAIGVADSTLRRWLSLDEGGAQFRRVRIRGGAGRGLRGSLVVVSPSGFRLEGLDVEAAVEILRKL